MVLFLLDSAKFFVISAAHATQNPTMVSEPGSIETVNRLKNRLRLLFLVQCFLYNQIKVFNIDFN